MGFLLFAARKLQLKARVNQLNYRNMVLSQEQQTISKQIADAQKAQNAAKNMLNTQAQQFVIGNVLSGLSGNDAIKTLLESKNIGTCSSGDLQALLSGAKINVDGQDIQFNQDDFAVASPVYQQATYQAQMQAAYATNVMNGIFDAQSQVELAKLNAKDSQIGLEMENNESQSTIANAEYQSVKKAEGEEARNSAPTFGLA